MEDSPIGFESILNATVRMFRTTWKTRVCLFLQADDGGRLRVRASDGISLDRLSSLLITPEGPLAQCFSKNKVLEIDQSAPMGALTAFLKHHPEKNEKYILAPVSGETRVLGILVLGPFSKKEKNLPHEAELRSAGALCAVLSAHCRLYQWMSNFLPGLNRELRTPLTAVQGSIGLVLGGMFGQVGTDVKEMLEMAQKGCERTVRAIEEYINTQNPK